MHLGYSRPEAERAAERAMREHGDGRFEDLLRFALQVVSAPLTGVRTGPGRPAC